MTMPWTLEEKKLSLARGIPEMLSGECEGWMGYPGPAPGSRQQAAALASLLTAVGYHTVASLSSLQPHMVFSLPKTHSCLLALHILPCTLALLLRVRGWGGVSLFL